MSMEKRLQKELLLAKKDLPEGIRDLCITDDNITKWKFLVVPTKKPYNKGAFRVEIQFPDDYPFRPPKIMFATKIYHPNIDEKGNVCLTIANPEAWKPSTTVADVMKGLVNMVNDPEPDHPLRVELAKEFKENRKKFDKTAEACTVKHAEKRPSS